MEVKPLSQIAWQKLNNSVLLSGDNAEDEDKVMEVLTKKFEAIMKTKVKRVIQTSNELKVPTDFLGRLVLNIKNYKEE